jgi:hypothetical protein
MALEIRVSKLKPKIICSTIMLHHPLFVDANIIENGPSYTNTTLVENEKTTRIKRITVLLKQVLAYPIVNI